MEIGSRTIRDAFVVRLGGIDDVGSGLAAEYLEGQMLGIALSANDIPRRDSVWLGRRLRLTELVTVDISRSPAGHPLRSETASRNDDLTRTDPKR